MAPVSLLPLTAAVLVLYLAVRCYLNHRKCPQFDGPLLAKISGAWLFIHTFSGKLNQHNAAILEKYGQTPCAPLTCVLSCSIRLARAHCAG